jgi:hypothetical protein
VSGLDDQQRSVKQGVFNVPSGGVSNGGWLYAFFWTNHCNNKDECPESAELNSVGRGVLARSNNDGITFGDAVWLPPHFAYATAVDAGAIADLPSDQRLGTYVFGVPEYRSSVPYLAYAPEGKLQDPRSWKFFVSRRADGQPKWVTSDAWNNGDPFLFARLNLESLPDRGDENDAGRARHRAHVEHALEWGDSVLSYAVGRQDGDLLRNRAVGSVLGNEPAINAAGIRNVCQVQSVGPSRRSYRASDNLTRVQQRRGT